MLFIGSEFVHIMYSLARCAAIVMNRPEYAENVNWKFNSGHLDFLGEVYALYVEVNNVPKEKQCKSALQRNQAVRRSCKGSKDGAEYWHVSGRINYPGISNAYSDVFELKEKYRSVQSL